MLETMFNNGLVYTNELCIGCNKCINACPCKGANQVINNERKRNRIIKVRGNECISCGYCIRVCNHNARHYIDDTPFFFEDLGKGEEISVLVAPSFLADEKEHRMLAGYLKHLGVKHIYNVSLGSEIISWLYIDYMKNNKRRNMISSLCPSIVSYILKYVPEEIGNLMPFVSPMMATAVYVRKYLGRKEKLAFLGPCISKKQEFSYPGYEGYIDYNVTFASFEESIKGVDISKYDADVEFDHGLSCIVPLKGGLKSSIENLDGFKNLIYEITERDFMWSYLKEYSKEMKDKDVYLIAAVACKTGCMKGVGISERMKSTVIERYHYLNEYGYAKEENFSGADNFDERLQKRIDEYKNLNKKDFMINFDGKKVVAMPKITQAMIDSMFEKMYKYTYDEKNINCQMCGYDSCSEMAKAVISRRNSIDNCVFYARKKMAREKGQVKELLTKMTEMNEELIANADIKSNFLANMSHEIRTPMNAILGMADIVLRGELNDVEKEYVSQIRNAGLNLLEIINDILDFSKVESGNLELVEEEYEMEKIVVDVINSVAWRAYQKKIQFFVYASPLLPKILKGDFVRIRQVFINLLNNAVKFTRKGSVTLRIEHIVKEGKDYIKTSIKDTGIGIKEEDMPKIYNAFQQLDTKKNRNIEGTGLGLAITHMLVELMHGTISVESEYGVGTEFIVELPYTIIDYQPSAVIKNSKVRAVGIFTDGFVEEELRNVLEDLGAEYITYVDYEAQNDIREDDFVFSEVETYESFRQKIEKFFPQERIVVIPTGEDIYKIKDVVRLRRPVQAFDLAKVFNGEEIVYYDEEDEYSAFDFIAPDAKILIVDDNTVNLSVAKNLLEPLNMVIKTAESGKEAIKCVSNNKFDIVFLDHMMPDLDGLETTRIIRNKDDEYFKKLPIVALTANALHGVKEKFLNEGMNGFVSKPIKVKEIIAEIKKWLPPEKIKQPEGPVINRVKKKKYNKDFDTIVIDGVDVRAAQEYIASKELYLEILSDFYNEIEKKSDIIVACEEKGDIKRYTIEVHALATVTRLIGATEFSKFAKVLEGYGHEEKIDKIHKETPEFIRQYRDFLNKLKPFVIENKKGNNNGSNNAVQSANKKRIRKDTLRKKLVQLMEWCDDCDSKRSMEAVEDLNNYALSKKNLRKMEVIKGLIGDLEYDDAQNIIQTWINEIK